MVLKSKTNNQQPKAKTQTKNQKSRMRKKICVVSSP